MMQTKQKQAAKISRRTFEKISALILAVILLCAGTAFATTPAEYVVDIYDGAEITRVKTTQEDPYAIVKQNDIALQEHDKLDLSNFVTGKNSTIVIYRGAQVSFTTIEGETQELICAGTVQDLLAATKVALAEDQVLNLPNDTVLSDGLAVKVLNLLTLYISVDGEKKEIKMAEGNVSDALLQANVVLGDVDEVSPALDTPVQDQLEISVYRVSYQERTAKETIKYKKTSKKDSKMLVGTSKVTQQGQNGSKEVLYQDKYIDGKLESSKALSENILVPAVDEITVKGTMKKSISHSKLKNGGHPISELTPPTDLKIVDGKPTSYSKIIRGKAAAYSAKPTAKTASGRRVKPGYIAVNPAQIPYGTEMWIVSTEGHVYGYAIAADTGAFIHQGKFTVDLFMSTNAECRQWGARDVIIYIL